MAKSKKEDNQDRLLAIQHVHRMQGGILNTRACLSGEQFELLIDEILAAGVPAAGYVRYVCQVRSPNFHVKSIYGPGLISKYKDYCYDHELNVHSRIKSMLRIFETKRAYISLEKLLAEPRYDINSIIRWCLAKRHNIVPKDKDNLLKLVYTDLLCYPWYNHCLDLLPELVEIPEEQEFRDNLKKEKKVAKAKKKEAQDE